MNYDFDEGSSGGDSATGPFLNWHARETLDGVIPGRSFSIRDEDGERKNVTPSMKKNVVFDLDSLRTGWCFSNGSPGVAPQWVWNDSPARFNQTQPPDIGEERWKKGFSIRLALGKDNALTWSQAGAGAWQGLTNLMRAVKADGGEGEVVVAKMGTVEEIKFKKGGTSAPDFTIVKWTERPDCLVESSPAVVTEDAVDEF